MYIGFGAAITVPVRPCGRLDTLEPRSHQELLDRKGIFYKLVEVQSESSRIIGVAE